MPKIFNCMLFMSPRMVLFVLVFTIAAMGLNPAGKTSITIGFVSLLFQITLVKSVTKYAFRDRALLSYLQYLYITNALCQLFIVRKFAQYLIAWAFAQFCFTFPGFAGSLLSKMYDLFDKASSVSNSMEGAIQRSSISIRFSTMGNILNNPELRSTAVSNFFWNLQTNLKENPTGTFRRASVSASSAAIGQWFEKFPLFFLIPTEIVKYHLLKTAVKSRLHEKIGSGCRDVLAMAMMLSFPIANIQVVSSPDWKADMHFGGGLGVLALSLEILTAYMSSMISCGILGLVFAENLIFKHDKGMLSARIMSGLMMCVTDVMTGLCVLYGILTDSTRIAFSFSLLVMMMGAGLFVWVRFVQMTVDEHAIMTRRESEGLTWNENRMNDD